MGYVNKCEVPIPKTRCSAECTTIKGHKVFATEQGWPGIAESQEESRKSTINTSAPSFCTILLHYIIGVCTILFFALYYWSQESTRRNELNVLFSRTIALYHWLAVLFYISVTSENITSTWNCFIKVSRGVESGRCFSSIIPAASCRLINSYSLIYIHCYPF